jgi:uncharacterized membrane protein HdeD (DUF308 family)
MDIAEEHAMDRALGPSVLISILLIIAGLLAIFVPQIAGITIMAFLGWLLIVGGAAHLAFAWSRRHAGGFVWELILGVLYIIAGVYLLMNPVAGLAVLTLMLGAYLIGSAAVEFVLSVELRRLPGAGWLVLNGIITLILGLMIVANWPVSTVWAIGTLVGVSILFSGITRLGLALSMRRQHRLRMA